MLTWTRYQLLLAILLVFGGTINTLSQRNFLDSKFLECSEWTFDTKNYLLTKLTVYFCILVQLALSLLICFVRWTGHIKARGTDNKLRTFRHPFFGAAIMFAGEILCILLFKICLFHYRKKKLHNVRVIVRGNRDFNSWIFFLPSACDVIARSVMFVGLSLTYTSSSQMLGGSLIVFVAVLSIGFLGRKITPVEWIGIFFVIIGLLLGGVSDFVANNHSQSEDIEGRDVLIGDLLIVLAQVISAIQIVLEEHFVRGKNIPPLQAVGLEGCFGVCIMGLLFIPLYYIRVGEPISINPDGRLEDLNDSFMQIQNELILLVPLLGMVFSIGIFNYAGIGVTKELSGTTRTVLDSLSTIFIWVVSISVGWQVFFGLQVFGFIVLIIGIFVYHDILLPFIARKTWEAITAKGRRREETVVEEPDGT